ncbi:MAG TPA: 16S rRNA (guanine(966)-N(2))-methyltransferase RsmD [Methylophilaceae bacterium]|nr:16S rRNA (guanine(966)-N(2))-methyltransferase RsmD [Methylophilaceae bacterium]
MPGSRLNNSEPELTAAQSNKVRIGGGQWRSRLLRFPELPGLRPTPDRVRETLFNWLGQDLEGLTCLDLFSGTGALGFEALSRGASKAVMVEQALPAFKALLENRKLLGAGAAEIIHQGALQFLDADSRRFDVIFLDPPFNQDWLSRLLPLLRAHLAPDGMVYAEAEAALADNDDWQVWKHGKAGNVFYHLLKSAHAT